MARCFGGNRERAFQERLRFMVAPQNIVEVPKNFEGEKVDSFRRYY